jgi:transketolase
MNLDEQVITTIRTLSMDAVQRANSGHPGTPMALAPVVHVLWDRFLRFNPANPRWLDRDRFILSAGHASMLLYSALHLNGYDLPLEQLEQFRQWGSHTPGHPEYSPDDRITPGVETTTGPLGQGVATSVGMAAAARWLEARFNRPGYDLFDYQVFAVCGDGDMMEGVSSEAASLAGHLGLSNLHWIYDNNHITIEGNTALAFSEDVATRFTGYGWHVERVVDANNLEQLERAFTAVIDEQERPSLIIVDSHIAYGAPHKQDTSAAHGEPLGEEEVRETKIAYGCDPDRRFYVPPDVAARIDRIRERGAAREAAWNERRAAWAAAFPDLGSELALIERGELPDGWEAAIPAFPPDPKGMATRDAGGKVLNAIAARIPWLFGGAADLAPSTKTRLTGDDAGDFEKESYGGRNFHFGIREHAMAAAVNGLALSGLRPFGATFLIFSDYMRPALRLSALMELPVIHVFTHDSIGLGEDGPTHQPVEQLASLRAIPHLTVLRPADANEVAEAWRVALRIHDYTGSQAGPVAVVLTRQPVPTFDRSQLAPAAGLRRGGYVLADPAGPPQAILIATGSEVQWCLAARDQLAAAGIAARVVSLPSWEIFERQPAEYRESVLPRACRARVAVEMASTFGWERYVGPDGRTIGLRAFGASAPIRQLLQEFGFTVEQIVATTKEVLAGLETTDEHR